MMNKALTAAKENILLYSVLILGFFLRLFYIFRFTTPEMYLWSDPGAYDQRALQMAKGYFVMFSTYWPPFFHIFLSLVYRPLVWLGLEAWRIKIDIFIFALFYVLGFWCIFQIIKKLFSLKIAFTILLILIFWYPLIFLNYLIMSENLFFPLIFLGLYLLMKNPEKAITGLWLGLLWAVAFLARPVFALALPVFVVWALYYKINKRLILNFLIFSAGILACMMAFNFYYTNGAEKSVSSNGGLNFAMTWCDAKSIEFKSSGYIFGFGPPANIDYAESKRFFTTVPFENQNYYYTMGLDCIKENPRALFTNISSAVKIFKSHLFPTIGNVAYWEGLRKIFNALNIILFALSALSITGLLSGFIKNPYKKYLYLIALIFLTLPVMAYLQVVGEERYLIPYAPLLIILSVPSIFYIFKLLKTAVLKPSVKPKTNF